MHFKKTWELFILAALLAIMAGCSNDTGKPDVSNIAMQVQVKRFDQFLFEKLDTNRLPGSLSELQAAFPSFTADFVTHILGLPAIHPVQADSGTRIGGSELKRFIRLSKPLYDSLLLRFGKTEWLENELNQAFKHVKYYFPSYDVPDIITYVGPFDAPAIAITRDALGIGLQLFAGKDFPFYTSAAGQELYPAYISRRFEPRYITVNAMKAVAEDLYADKSIGGSLIAQMVEKGKQWYLLDRFLPDAADSLKTGYTRAQLEWVNENEGLIWNSFLQGNDIYTTEPAFIKNYIGEAPSTQGMPESSPGNIGQWVGWKIVQAFATRHPEMPLQELLNTDARKIFTESKYKPR